MSTTKLDLKAKEVMNTQIVAARPETTGRNVAFQLLSGSDNGLPVIDMEKNIIGVVTEFDILKAVEEGKDLDKVRAEQIMTVPPITVDEDTPLRNVLTLMRKDRILSIPVVKDGKIKGILFRTNILNHLVATAEMHFS